MVGEITFLTYSINNVNKCTLTLDMMEYLANMANTPGTEENSARFFFREEESTYLLNIV